MDSIENRVLAFTKLGGFLSQFSQREFQRKNNVDYNDLFFDGFKHQLKLAQENNAWFTKETIVSRIKNWTNLLTKDNLNTWVDARDLISKEPKNVAVIMAGNIPLVGFHDFLSVLISGHSILIKQSSNDKHILPLLAKYLEQCNPSFKGKIIFEEGRLNGFDAVIATGSNNTARYFEYYFKNKPSIIRKNRNAVAVIKGDESKDELQKLSDDIFQYFGLGCRSVSKLYVPEGYDFDNFFGGVYAKKEIINNTKYANNYDYNKAVYLMSEFDLLENGFLMLKEDKRYSSPIATAFYEYYNNLADLKIRLYQDRDNIQCIVAKDFIENEIAFGQAQNPTLWDYADGVDTLEFLASI